MTNKASIRALARLLLLIGGVILILSAVLSLVGGLRGVLDFAPRAFSLDSLTGGIIGLLVGVLALIGAGQVRNPAWAIILLILGFFVGGLGGILVFIGALIALVAAFI